MKKLITKVERHEKVIFYIEKTTPTGNIKMVHYEKIVMKMA